MLYRAYEAQRTVANGFGRVLDSQAAALAVLPRSGVRGLPARNVLAANRVAKSWRLSHERPNFRIERLTSDGTRAIAVRERVVAETPFASLMRFVKVPRSSSTQPKVLIVPGLAGHFATLTRDTIGTMLRDHDVHVVDWKNARDVPPEEGRFGLDEYIEHLISFLEAIGSGVHLLSLCQPAVASIATAAILSEDSSPIVPASLILVAGPVDIAANPGRVSRIAQRIPLGLMKHAMVQVVPRRYAGAGRRVYPGFAQIVGFMSIDPRRHARTFAQLFRDLRNEDGTAAEKTLAFYEEYFAVLDTTEEYYLETAKRVFIDNDLAHGRFVWNGRPVDPSTITCGLLTIEGELDEMVLPGVTEAAHGLCSSIPAELRDHLLQAGVGHYGVFAGTVFEQQIYPRIRDFVLRNENGQKIPTEWRQRLSPRFLRCALRCIRV